MVDLGAQVNNMILNTTNFKDACKLILAAIDNKESTLFTETLELKAKDRVLKLNVTNREYYCTVEFPLESDEVFNAAVNASVFLRLISKLTTDTIEITKESNYIKIKGNGDYKLPIIFNNDKMVELPTIEIENVTTTMHINSDILNSIAIYNSKELQRGEGTRPVQKYYYVDEHGAITFTSGACVNSFNLEVPIKMLLSDKVVKLFRLFKPNSSVEFTMGQDPVTEDLIQTKVKFAMPGITITAKLSDSGLISSVPASTIRGMATKNFPYSVVVDRIVALQAIQRLLLFNESTIGEFTFKSDHLVVQDFSKNNTETIALVDDCQALEEYKMFLDLFKFKLILDGADDEYITLNFGDSKAVVIKKGSISDIIPEVRIQ